MIGKEVVGGGLHFGPWLKPESQLAVLGQGHDEDSDSDVVVGLQMATEKSERIAQMLILVILCMLIYIVSCLWFRDVIWMRDV